MRAKEYDVLDEAIRAGVRLGWNRAHKHVDVPEPPDIMEWIHRSVLECVSESFHLDDESEHISVTVRIDNDGE